MAAARTKTPKTAEQQLARFLAKFTPEIARLARAVRAKLRARLPGAVELVYDNYNALVIGFGATERPSEATFSIALFPRKVAVCFIQGARLRDPRKILRGSGNQVRNILVADAAELDRPEVRDLMARAIE